MGIHLGRFVLQNMKYTDRSNHLIVLKDKFHKFCDQSIVQDCLHGYLA